MYIHYGQAGQPTTFTFEESEAVWEKPGGIRPFFLQPKREGDDVDIRTLSVAAQKLFVQPGGPREKDWTSMRVQHSNGYAAVAVHRGGAAHRIKQSYSHRIIPSRWHEM